MLFVDKSEMFVVEFMDDGCQRKRKLTQMKNKIVHHIHEDPHNSGFYILCSKEYDELLELEHTHRDEIDINFESQVEPGIIKIFNMNISSEKYTQKSNTKRIAMSFVGMRDDEFTFDRCSYLETMVLNNNKNSSSS